MTDLHADLVALADRARIGPLDLIAVEQIARSRRRQRRLAFAVPTAAVAVVAVTLGWTGSPHIDDELTSRPGSAAPPSALTESGPTDGERGRLLQIADQQAQFAGGVAGRVVALRTTSDAYARATGTSQPALPGEIWVVQVTGDTYTCAQACFVVRSPTPSGAALTLVVDAATFSLAGVAVGQQPANLPGAAFVLRP